ncbi:MAG: GHKL domain-containing protein [Alistipes sp.]|nr:GHKL domain-containing protein [Alistipes sp.]
MAGLVDFFSIYIEGSIETFVMLYFFPKFLRSKINLFHYLIFGVTGIVCMILFSGNSLVQFSVLAFLLTIEGICFCRSGFDTSVLYAVVTIEIMLLCYGIVNSLSGILSPIFFPANPKTTGLLLMTGGNFIALSLSVCCYHIVRKYFIFDTAPKAQHTLMILTPALTIFLVNTYINFCIYGSSIWVDKNGRLMSTYHYPVLFMQLLGIASLFCVLYAYKKLLDSFLLNMKISLLEQEADFLQQYVTEARIRYEKTKSFRHDIKNHMTVLRELLKTRQTEQALSYMGELENLSADMSFPCNTNNPVLNILLSNKLGIAQNNGVDVSCSLSVPYPCPISDIDLCIVLSNALDNAVHASADIKSGITKYIQVTGTLQGDFLLIEIQNSFQDLTPFKEGTGLRNIRTVAEKYHGAVNIQTQENVFILSVLLIIPQQPESISR